MTVHCRSPFVAAVERCHVHSKLFSLVYAVDQTCVEVDEKSTWNDVEKDRPEKPANTDYFRGKVPLDPEKLLAVSVLGHNGFLHKYWNSGQGTADEYQSNDYTRSPQRYHSPCFERMTYGQVSLRSHVNYHNCTNDDENGNSRTKHPVQIKPDTPMIVAETRKRKKNRI